MADRFHFVVLQPKQEQQQLSARRRTAHDVPVRHQPLPRIEWLLPIPDGCFLSLQLSIRPAHRTFLLPVCPEYHGRPERVDLEGFPSYHPLLADVDQPPTLLQPVVGISIRIRRKDTCGPQPGQRTFTLPAHSTLSPQHAPGCDWAGLFYRMYLADLPLCQTHAQPSRSAQATEPDHIAMDRFSDRHPDRCVDYLFVHDL